MGPLTPMGALTMGSLASFLPIETLQVVAGAAALSADSLTRRGEGRLYFQLSTDHRSATITVRIGSPNGLGLHTNVC